MIYKSYVKLKSEVRRSGYLRRNGRYSGIYWRRQDRGPACIVYVHRCETAASPISPRFLILLPLLCFYLHINRSFVPSLVAESLVEA